MRNNQKKITALLITAVLCLCLVSCAKGTSDNANTKSNTVTEQESVVIEEPTTISQDEGPNSDSSENAQAATKRTENAASKPEYSTTTKGSNKPSVQATTKPTTTESTTKASNTCTITIDCSSILDNKDDLKPGHEEFVPGSGYILKNYEIKVNSGQTVYDILNQACKSNGIILTTKSSPYGIYVVGINNLDEFDCGKSSGWKYKVNGTDANRGCSNYKLNGGESIVFYYTVTG